MTLHNGFVSLETGSPACTRTCLPQSLTKNKCYQHDYYGSRNHAVTPRICYKDMGHKSGHFHYFSFTSNHTNNTTIIKNNEKNSKIQQKRQQKLIKCESK